MRCYRLVPRASATVLFYVLALGCGDATGVPAELVLGGGESRFLPLMDGDGEPLVAGSQGGHHLWLSLRASGLEPDDVRMELDVTPPAPAPPAHSDVQISLTPSDDPALPLEFVGWPARVLMPECAVGEAVGFAVTLRDRRGRTASAAITLRAEPPQLPFARACGS